MLAVTPILTARAERSHGTGCLTPVPEPACTTRALSSLPVAQAPVLTFTALLAAHSEPALDALQFTGKPGPPFWARASPADVIT